MATMMLEIPDALKSMFDPMRELLTEAQAQVERNPSVKGVFSTGGRVM